MANNIDKKEPVAICDQSKIDVTKCNNHELAGNIEPLIKVIRGQQVMLDKDLATLYGVETRVLNQTVKRIFRCNILLGKDLARNHTIGVNRHAVFGRVSLPHLTFLATEDQHQRKYY